MKLLPSKILLACLLCLTTLLAAETPANKTTPAVPAAPAAPAESVAPDDPVAPVAPAAANATDESRKDKQPLAYQINPSPVSLGKLAFGNRTDFNIQILNKGDKELTIKKVRPSCNCLTAESFTTDVIKPGAFGEIKGRIIADEKEGETRKLFYIHLTDDREPIAQVVVNVQFVKPEGSKVVLSNEVMEFGKVSLNDKKRLAVCRVMNFGDQPLKITEIVNTNKALELKLDTQEAVEPHQGVNLRAFLDAQKAGKGKIEEEIFLMTDSPISPAVSLKVTATVE